METDASVSVCLPASKCLLVCLSVCRTVVSWSSNCLCVSEAQSDFEEQEDERREDPPFLR